MRLTSTERHDTSPEVARVERHINTRERDSGEATLELDVTFGLLELLCALEAGLDDVKQHLLDLLDAELLSELRHIYQPQY